MSTKTKSIKHIRWRIIGTLTTRSPLHIGSGDNTTFDHAALRHVDDNDKQELNEIQAVVKDHRQKPCIPGTALKGVLRSWGEQFLPEHNNDIARIFGIRDVDSEKAESGWAEFCTAFVNDPDQETISRLSSNVPFWNAKSLTGIVSHVCIDRNTGAAAHNKLFFEEFVPERITFKVTIEATRLTEQEVQVLLTILENGAKHRTHPLQFGANGADGWGQMNWELEGVTPCNSLPSEFTGTGFDCCTPKVKHFTPITCKLATPSVATCSLLLAVNGPFLVNDASRRKEKTEESSDKSNFTPLRRANGKLWLPASSLRGALRERCEFLLRSLNSDATGDPNEPTSKSAGPIERLFGYTGQRARLQLKEPDQLGGYATGKQDFVAIDRFTGGAADGAKFDATYADSPQFQTQLTLDLRGLNPEDLALLRLALDDVVNGNIPLGWGRSKGYGEVSGTLSQTTTEGIDEKWAMPSSVWSAQRDQDCLAWLKKHLSGLSHLSTRSSASVSKAATPISTVLTPTVQDGTLEVQETKKGWKYVLSYKKTTGKPATITVFENQIHSSLRGTAQQGTNIDFEWEGSKQVRIRPRGHPWEEMPQLLVNQSDGNVNGFAHSYYFLRMNDRMRFQGELGDTNPVAEKESSRHRRYLPGHLSGTLRVKFTVATPLLVCADTTVSEDENGHTTYDVLVDRVGKPKLASASVRGMLRSAYEAITNSRFGVFPFKPDADIKRKGNARRQGYRINADDGLSFVPIMIKNGKSRLLLGNTSGLPKWDEWSRRWKVPGDLYAAWVKQYDKDVSGYSNCAITINGAQPHHGQEAWCWLEKMKHNKIPFTLWKVRVAASDESSLSVEPPTQSSKSDNYSPCNEPMIKRKGYFVISNQNIKNKHDERFFFGGPVEATLANEVYERYQDLIEDCQDIHSAELEDRQNKGISPTKYEASITTKGRVEKSEVAAMSRHTYEPAVITKDEGVVLCYGFVEKLGPTYHVRALYPVTISRKLYDKPPLDLLPLSLRPAANINELSPADRVFGWVSQDPDQVKGAELAAFKSLVRVGPVKCETGASDAVETFQPKTLAILGQPKPQQGRFYLGNKVGQAHKHDLSKELAGYTGDNRIRGPKVYPHHKLAEIYENAEKWQQANPQAFSDERSNQNRSVKGWVRPGTEFTFDLHLTNLTATELGALVWLLSLPDEHYLRLGLGKPLGFGSVRLEIDHAKSLLADGKAWIESLASPKSENVLPTKIPDDEMEQMGSDFKTAIDNANPTLLRTFQRAMSGFGNLPIHYPRLPNKPEHFHWFVENERGEKHYSLPDLESADVSLPKQPT